MENIVYCSHHGSSRIRERCGAKKKSALRIAENAISRGQHFSETKGSVKRWLEQQLHDKSNQIYVYGDKAFVFSNNNILVTVLQIPSDIARCNNNNKRKGSSTGKRSDWCEKLQNRSNSRSSGPRNLDNSYIFDIM